MENHTAVTMVRLYLPEEGHTTRGAQMEKVLRFLHDQLQVHGITTLAAMTEPGDNHKPHYRTVATFYEGIRIHLQSSSSSTLPKRPYRFASCFVT